MISNRNKYIKWSVYDCKTDRSNLLEPHSAVCGRCVLLCIQLCGCVCDVADRKETELLQISGGGRYEITGDQSFEQGL